MKKLFSILMVMVFMVTTLLAAGGFTKVTKAPTTLPRTQTLYYGGLQWDAVKGWNPLSDDNNNGFMSQSSGGSRSVMFETLYMYNMMDGSMRPMLADGPYKWNANMTEMTVKIKKAAKWSDGTALTAYDVAATWKADLKVGNAQGVGLKDYIASVVAKDSKTVLIKSVIRKGKPANPLMLVSYLAQTYVIQSGWISKVEKRNGNDAAKIKKDKGEDAIYSGPYHNYYADNQKIVLIRNDSYWGKDKSMWGKLAAPKYIAHSIYKDNDATLAAFKAGQIDVDQQFISNVQDLWLKDNLPISTYMDQAPYGICANMPTAFFNMSKPGLDNVVVRKAIAIAVDYDAINQNAMTGQSPTFKQVPRSLMNPTPGEQATFDHDAVKDLQWAGNDIAAANAMLDKAGIKDTNGDKIRDIKGVNLSFNAVCPNGWTDWMASMEIVAAAGKKIGIDITTKFPEYSVYQTIVTAAKQSDYDIFMMWTNSADPTEPWGRVRNLMSNDFNGHDGNWSGNYGHYVNPKIDALIDQIPLETNAAKLKADYTEAVKIYLTDVPSFSLMYRPNLFHAVNESVWTNYPDSSDGKSIPPLILTDGYSIAGLYNLKLAK